MSDDSRLRAILEELLDTGASPDDVCRDCPELLDEVRTRLHRLREVESQVDALFPPSSGSHTSGDPFDISAADAPLEVPGYRIDGVLGRGGVGLVFKAHHLKLNRPVALKMLLSGRLASPKERARFRQEAEAVASLRHTNIIHIYDVGEVDGRPFFTMEFVDDGDLAQRLAGKPQPPRDAATIAATLADVVAVAHAAGIVHRDLKPANVLLCSDGVPKVTDFGLARRLEGNDNLTVEGAGVGTPSYMAPEQASGRATGFCPSEDIYSLGAILYEMLTGRPPFRGATPAETHRQILEDEPAPPSRINTAVPRDLETVCLKCLQKDPNQRYASADALRSDLNAFLEGRSITARPASRIERLMRWIRRNRALAALIATSIGLLVVVSIAALREWNLAIKQRAEMTRWKERLEYVIALEKEGRFDEVRAILGRVPDAGSVALRREIAQAEADLNLVEQLDKIRMSRGARFEGGGINYGESARQYADVFHASGLGSVDNPPELTADRIGRSAVRSTIIAALDDWAACAEAPQREWILAVARHVDPDPWRDQVRSQAHWADLDTLAKLAKTADIDHQPVTIMVAMSTRWRRLGGDPTAFLQRVYERFPSDFWVNFELSLLLESKDPEDAVGHCRAALAIRPDAALVHYNLGVFLKRLGRLDEAEFYFRQAVKFDPTHAWAQLNLGVLIYNKRQWRDALVHFRASIAIEKENEQARFGEECCLLHLGRAEEVRQAWAKRLGQSPTAHEAWDGYAELCLFLGDKSEYRRACGELLTRFGAATDPHICERTGRACLLGNVSPQQNRTAAALIDRALAGDKKQYGEWAYPYFLFAKSLAAYRLGHYEEAAKLASGDASGVLGPSPGLVLAMSLYRMHKESDARRSLAQAIQKFDWTPEDAVQREDWIYQILRREAESLILPKLSDFLQGRYTPRDNNERFALLGACQEHQQFALAATLYRDAFKDDPSLEDDLAVARRYSAARFAAIAGTQDTPGANHIPEDQRVLWRKQALAWLRQDLDALAKLAATNNSTDRQFCVQRLELWQSDSSLASLRDEQAIKSLPATEQNACRAIWAQVDTLVKRCNGN